MINIINGDLLKSDAKVIAHQSNCFHVMGGGIAKQLKDKYPEVYQADLLTERGDSGKLGTFSVAEISDDLTVFNMYSQYVYGRGTTHTNMYFVEECFYQLAKHLKLHPELGDTISIPYKYGCGLAGGDWGVVLNILGKLLGEFGEFQELTLNIYKL